MKHSCPLTIMQSKEQKVNQAINVGLSIPEYPVFIQSFSWNKQICLNTY